MFNTCEWLGWRVSCVVGAGKIIWGKNEQAQTSIP